MYLFDFPSKITKVKKEKEKDNQPHGSYDQCYLKKKKKKSYDWQNTNIAIENLCSTYLTCTQLDFMKKMTNC